VLTLIYTLSGRSRLITRQAMTAPVFPLRAVTALFLERQHLTRRAPTAHPRPPDALRRGRRRLQMDSINVLDRAHYSRSGAARPYDARLVRWSTAAGFPRVLGPRSLSRARLDAAGWKRAMLDYRGAHRWSNWLRAIPTAGVGRDHPRQRPDGHGEWRRAARAAAAVLVELAARAARDPLSLMTGVLTVHSRRHFQKRYDLLERAVAVPPGTRCRRAVLAARGALAPRHGRRHRARLAGTSPTRACAGRAPRRPARDGGEAM